MEINFKETGIRIKIARVRANMTQKRLANIVNVSPTHISNIETGNTQLSLSLLVQIANVLSVSTDELLQDNVLYAKHAISHEIEELLASCDEYEVRLLSNIMSASLQAIRKDSELRKSISEMLHT